MMKKHISTLEFHFDPFQEAKNDLSKHMYELISQIGEGGYSNVYLCKSLRYDTEFAVKQMFTDHARINDAMSELQALRLLNHPNIIQIFDYFVEKNCLYYVLEYCPNGSLQDMINKNGYLTMPTMLPICRKVIEALHYCFENNIAHHDIKPANILFDAYGRPKLADFGISLQTDKKTSNKFTGSLQYMAPEIVAKRSYDPFQADIWSLGVTFFQMAVGRTPWPQTDKDKIKKAILAGNVIFPREIKGNFTVLLSQMLQVDYTRRITMNELLNNPIMKAEKKKLESKSLQNISLSNTESLLSLRIVADNRKHHLDTFMDDEEEDECKLTHRNPHTNYPRAFKHVIRAELQLRKSHSRSVFPKRLLTETFTSSANIV